MMKRAAERLVLGILMAVLCLGLLQGFSKENAAYAVSENAISVPTDYTKNFTLGQSVSLNVAEYYYGTGYKDYYIAIYDSNKTRIAYKLISFAGTYGRSTRSISFASSYFPTTGIYYYGVGLTMSKVSATYPINIQSGSSGGGSSTVTVYSVDDLQSSHPYSNSMDKKWVYTVPGATELNVTFDSRTEVESGFDYLKIYDGNNNLIGTYTGTELAGQTIVVPGDTVIVGLKSDVSVNKWGFAVVSAENAHEHTFGPWMETNPASCTEGGQEGRMCTQCNEWETRETEALGHAWNSSYTVDVEPTAETPGVKSIHCSRCSATKDAVEIPPVDPNWIEKDGKTYYLLENGSYATSWTKIKDEWHFFRGDGSLVTEWYKEDGKWYYLDPADHGRMLTGWQTIEGDVYFFNSVGQMIQKDWYKINGDWYYFTGTGAKAIGWTKVENKWYYMDSNGIMIKGWFTDPEDNALYYFDGTGAMAQSEFKKIDGVWYYFKITGAKAMGWQKVDEDWYYFEPSLGGALYQGQWLSDAGDRYYFGATGAMVKGWQKINNQWYYFKTNGAAVKGFVNVDGLWYYFDPYSNLMMTGWVEDGGKEYYMKSSGVMATGWMQVGADWYYLNPSTGALSHDFTKINGLWYYFDPVSGAMRSGLQYIKGSWYYFDPAKDSTMVAGDWFEIEDGKWRCFLDTGEMIVYDCYIIDGDYYIFGQDGDWTYLAPIGMNSSEKAKASSANDLEVNLTVYKGLKEYDVRTYVKDYNYEKISVPCYYIVKIVDENDKVRYCEYVKMTTSSSHLFEVDWDDLLPGSTAKGTMTITMLNPGYFFLQETKSLSELPITETPDEGGSGSESSGGSTVPTGYLNEYVEYLVTKMNSEGVTADHPIEYTMTDSSGVDHLVRMYMNGDYLMAIGQMKYNNGSTTRRSESNSLVGFGINVKTGAVSKISTTIEYLYAQTVSPVKAGKSTYEGTCTTLIPASYTPTTDLPFTKTYLYNPSNGATYISESIGIEESNLVLRSTMAMLGIKVIEYSDYQCSLYDLGFTSFE